MSATEEKSPKQLAYEKFENVFKNTLVEQILGHAKKYKLPTEYLEYFEKVSTIVVFMFHQPFMGSDHLPTAT